MPFIFVAGCFLPMQHFTMRSLISNGIHTNPRYRILIRMHVNEMRSRETNHSASLHLVAVFHSHHLDLINIRRIFGALTGECDK